MSENGGATLHAMRVYQSAPSEGPTINSNEIVRSCDCQNGQFTTGVINDKPTINSNEIVRSCDCQNGS